jgi:hypothetical protein
MVDDLLIELRNINKAIKNINMVGKVAVVGFTTPSKSIFLYIAEGSESRWEAKQNGTAHFWHPPQGAEGQHCFMHLANVSGLDGVLLSIS